MDNHSDCPETIKYLDNLTKIKVIRNQTNNGPVVSNLHNRHVFDKLPEKYILTDPDLEFNPNLPSNFIELLSQLFI